MGFFSRVFGKRFSKEYEKDEAVKMQIRNKLQNYQRTEGKASFVGPGGLGAQVSGQVEVVETLDGNELNHYFSNGN